MKRKLLGVQSIPKVAENRAQRCQVSWRSSASNTGIDRSSGSNCGLEATHQFGARFDPLILFVVELAPTLCAQKAKDSWSNLNGLKAGQGIKGIESRMKSHSGQFVTVTDEMFSLQEEGSGVSIKREDVVRVSTSSGPRRGEHAVIGLVVGGGIGAAIAALAGSSHGFLGGSSRGIAAGDKSGDVVEFTGNGTVRDGALTGTGSRSSSTPLCHGVTGSLRAPAVAVASISGARWVGSVQR